MKKKFLCLLLAGVIMPCGVAPYASEPTEDKPVSALSGASNPISRIREPITIKKSIDKLSLEAPYTTGAEYQSNLGEEKLGRQARAVQGYCGAEGDGRNVIWEYNDTNGTLTITGNGKMADCVETEIDGDIDITPWQYYDYADYITTVIIGDTGSESNITNIGNYAFSGLKNLQTVTIHDNVTSFGKDAFYKCSFLQSITIPDSVTEIKSFAFYSCNSLESITIPANVQTLGEGVFRECSLLKSISVDAGNQNFTSENGVLFNKDKTTLIAYPARKTGNEYAIPESVTTIDNYAFVSCRLKEVTIPNGVTTIGEGAFSFCYNLAVINIPNSVTTIRKNAFLYCSFQNITIPANVTTLGEGAFGGCSALTNIVVDDKNEYFRLDGGVLFNKNKTTLIAYPAGKTGNEYAIPDGVITIDDYAFCDASLRSITIPDSVISVNYAAFSYCGNLRTVTFGAQSQLQTLGVYAFVECSKLTSIAIPDSVEVIEYAAFRSCRKLTTVEFGSESKLQTLGNLAFEDCSALENSQ